VSARENSGAADPDRRTGEEPIHPFSASLKMIGTQEPARVCQRQISNGAKALAWCEIAVPRGEKPFRALRMRAGSLGLPESHMPDGAEPPGAQRDLGATSARWLIFTYLWMELRHPFGSAQGRLWRLRRAGDVFAAPIQTQPKVLASPVHFRTAGSTNEHPALLRTDLEEIKVNLCIDLRSRVIGSRRA
jgi:hypothetical protein